MSESLREKLILWALGIMVAWTSFVTLALFERPTEKTVKELVSSDAPYQQDKRWIAETLARVEKQHHETFSKLETVIQKNTQAINDLRVEIAKGNKI